MLGGAGVEIVERGLALDNPDGTDQLAVEANRANQARPQPHLRDRGYVHWGAAGANGGQDAPRLKRVRYLFRGARLLERQAAHGVILIVHRVEGQEPPVGVLKRDGTIEKASKRPREVLKRRALRGDARQLAVDQLRTFDDVVLLGEDRPMELLGHRHEGRFPRDLEKREVAPIRLFAGAAREVVEVLGYREAESGKAFFGQRTDLRALVRWLEGPSIAGG